MAKTYSGIVGRQHISSLYPNVYRVSFRAMVAGRSYQVEKTITGRSEADARARAQNEYRDIRGSIAVEFVTTLDEQKG